MLETPNHAAQAPALNALIPSAALHFHEKVTANNKNNRGIHPLVAVKSHEANLALLVGRAISTFPSASSDGDDDPSQTIPVFSATKNWGLKKKPDFISVTRGPGMRSSLSVGLNHAKGLAVAWQIPLVGVNHMQAHALTPQLVSALASSGSAPPTPSFPFLSLLVSGGHTLLLHSRTLNDHSILASTSDTAIGDALDKMARSILPDAVIKSSAEIMYGRLLETFAFPDLDATDYGYTAPSKRCEELARKQTRWGWSLPVMLAETRSGSKSQAMLYTFCGLTAAVKRLCESEHAKGMSTDERVELAREAMRLAFEHLSSRIILALRQRQNDFNAIHSLVVSGGVASNQYLRTMYVISPSPPLLLSLTSLNNGITVFDPTSTRTPFTTSNSRSPRRSSVWTTRL